MIGKAPCIYYNMYNIVEKYKLVEKQIILVFRKITIKRLQFDNGPHYYTFVVNGVNLYANSVQMRTIAVINRVITLND